MTDSTQPPENAHEFDAASKHGVYEAIYRRRDMRSFRPDPIPMDALVRILDAANEAPSVGFMQPWNFVVVQSLETRQKIWEHVDAERVRAAEVFEGKRREQYLSLKLEGILDAPLGICVTCDRDRNGPAVLGRNSIRDTDVQSTCLAIQNLWLAARAEGIGIGWVSIYQPNSLRDILGIPEPIVPVAYLCAGYVDEFPARPKLETENWLDKIPLTDVVYGERWGEPAAGPLSKSLESFKR